MFKVPAFPQMLSRFVGKQKTFHGDRINNMTAESQFLGLDVVQFQVLLGLGHVNLVNCKFNNFTRCHLLLPR